MKTKIKAVPHTQLPGENVVEVTYNGRLLCTIVGADGPGIRIISRYVGEVTDLALSGPRTALPNVLEVTFGFCTSHQNPG